MEETMYAMMKECRNYFVADLLKGSFTIKDGTLFFNDNEVKKGEHQYYFVAGSAANDTLHKAGDSLKDEAFTGKVYISNIPLDFQALAKKIKTYNEMLDKVKDDLPTLGAFASESFDDYSYSLGSASSSQSAGGGNPLAWQNHYADDLRRYVKAFGDGYL